MPPETSVSRLAQLAAAAREHDERPPKYEELPWDEFPDVFADYGPQPATPAEVDIPEMEPAEGVSWSDADPVLCVESLQRNLSLAELHTTRLKNSSQSKAFVGILPLEVVYDSIVGAIDEVIAELQDAKWAAEQLKQLAIQADEAEEG